MAGLGPSCSPFVLVDQPAEDPSPSYSRRRQVGGRGHGDVVAVRWPQVPGSVRAMVVVVRGVLIQDRAQVPINLTDFEQTPMHVVFEAVRREAERYGVAVAGSEIVGLIPRKAIELS